MTEVDPQELRRLDEAATKGPWEIHPRVKTLLLCATTLRSVATTSNNWNNVDDQEELAARQEADAALIRYLRNHTSDIIEAMRDRERLNWLISKGKFSEVWRRWGGEGPFEETFRAAIDAAIKEGA